MKHRYDKKIIVFLLAIFISLSTFSGCYRNSSSESYSSSNSLSNISNNVSDYLSTNSYTSEEENFSSKNSSYLPPSENSSEESGEGKEHLGIRRFYSNDYRDFIGDIETFVYGLILNDLETTYSTFIGEIQLSSGEIVMGIAFTDYTEAYMNQEQTQICYISGFLPLPGEVEVPEEDYESGLLIYDVECYDENVSFAWVYKITDIWNHCVVYNKYLKYGINSQGEIDYTTTDYVRGECDTSLGPLYSYDEGRLVYDDNFGEYVIVNGVSLSNKINFKVIEEEMNRILEEQDFNYFDYELESAFYFALDVVNAYLLGKQDETFFGYPVTTLIEIAKTLEPLDVLSINENGLKKLSLDIDPSKTPTAATKWIVTGVCLTVFIAGSVFQSMCITCPLLSGVAGAVTGIAADIFMQVIFGNTKLDKLDFGQIAVSAVSGAISGFVGPYLGGFFNGLTGNATANKLLFYLADTAVDALLGGLEGAAFSSMKGNTFQEVVKSFGEAALIAAIFSGGFKAIGELVGAIGKGIKKSKIVSEIGENISETQKNGKIGKIIENIRNWFSTAVLKIDLSIQGTFLRSKWLASKTLDPMWNVIRNRSLSDLKKNNNKYGTSLFNANGVKTTLDDIDNNFLKYKNGEKVGFYFMDDGTKIDIVKINGGYGIEYDSPNKISIEGGITTNRYDGDNCNFAKFIKKIKEIWMDDVDSIPTDIKKLLQSLKIEGETLEETIDRLNWKTILEKVIQKSSWVVHESLDGKHAYLMPRKYHDFNKPYNGLHHMGGVKLAGLMKINISKINFVDLISYSII